MKLNFGFLLRALFGLHLFVFLHHMGNFPLKQALVVMAHAQDAFVVLR